GVTPLISYFGQATYFTELTDVGEVSLTVAPGIYRLRVSSAEGFTAAPVFLDVEVAPAEVRELTAVIDVVENPVARGWYGADLHHHSDVLDGYTEPHFVLRSELAAGVDVSFLSDHDSMVNNAEMGRLAAERNIPFIAATELSPSWAHFNAYPIAAGETISIDVGNATVQEIFAEARRMRAGVVQVNHPYNNYGYFRALENEVVPGGYSDDFDLVEVSSSTPNDETIPAVWALWNKGRRIYFSAGSDAHDVWNEVSGAVRMYVHVGGEFTIEKFIESLRKGHSYASAGPLVYPETMFGSEIRHVANDPLPLDFSVRSVRGLSSVTLIKNGNAVQTLNFGNTTALTSVNFIAQPDTDAWFSLVVLDAEGFATYTNPIWIRTADRQSAAQ
ncbi:MAG: CehA/McbA family metallohydrolase, partial [Gammaproteobacteria bacterium]|nr:CehA/McbA family metallohydrolase [Gammaproteobacteria bacterium]